MSELTRRGFLGAGAVALSGAALAGLVGCAPSKQDESEGTEKSEAAPTEGAYAVRASGAERFAIAPAKASELGDPDETCDWLVIGGGNTGLFGAIHGVELGMDTILLEKNPKTGGAGVGTEASQVFNDSKYLQESGSPCGTSAEIYHYFQMQNAWLSDGLLVSNYIKHNHGPHDWLYDNGMKTVFCASGGVEAPVGGLMYEGTGSGVNAFVTEKIEERGGRIFTSTGATKLVIDDNGAVVGALADGPDKSGMYISARNVLVGTGGFGANDEMVAYYIGEAGTIAYKRDVEMGIPHNGDGICMALGVGAVESQEMWAAAPGQGSPASPDNIWDSEVDRACREANLWVNDLGKRLGNEKWDAISSNFGVAYRQNGGYYWNFSIRRRLSACRPSRSSWALVGLRAIRKFLKEMANPCLAWAKLWMPLWVMVRYSRGRLLKSLLRLLVSNRMRLSRPSSITTSFAGTAKIRIFGKTPSRSTS